MSGETLKKVGTVVIGLLAVVLMFTIWNVLSKKVEDTTNKAIATMDAAAVSDYTSKDGETLSGSEVLNFITSKESAEDGVCICVKTTRGTPIKYVYDESYTKIDTATESTRKKAAKTKSDPSYINPNGKFDCSVKYDQNDASLINEIYFEQQ